MNPIGIVRHIEDLSRDQGLDAVTQFYAENVLFIPAAEVVGQESGQSDFLNATPALDHLLIFGRRHVEAVLAEFIEHYHRDRPHQGLAQHRPDEPADVVAVTAGRVERRDRLGGLIHEYSRAV